MERSLRLYPDVLSFDVGEEEGPAYHLKCGSVQFLLLAVAEDAGEPQPYCAVPEISIDLMVEDLEAVYRHMQAHGVTFVAEWEPSQDRFFIGDPDGLVFEFIQAR